MAEQSMALSATSKQLLLHKLSFFASNNKKLKLNYKIKESEAFKTMMKDIRTNFDSIAYQPYARESVVLSL